MHYSQYDDLVRRGAEVNGVREPMHQRTARFTVDAGIGERMLDDTGQHPVDLGDEGLSKTRLLVVVPASGVEDLGLGFRPKDKAGRDAPPASFRRTSSQGMAEPGFATCSAMR